MSNISKIRTPSLDRLSAAIPLVDFRRLDIRQPALVRVMVDGAIAKEMLEINVKNRRQRKVAVEYLKHQIETGEWRDDHPQPVIFSDAGRLIDGQHRLQAIADLDLQPSDAVLMRVETGARDDVREYLDTGVPRTLDDRVELVADHLHNKIIAQLCTYAAVKSGGSKRPTPEEAKEFYILHEEAAMFVAKEHRREKGVGKMQVAYAAMEYYELDKAKAKEFYPAIFVVDSDIQQARILRDYCLRSLGTTKSQENSSATRRDLYLRAIACMKAHRDGRKISIVRRAEW